MFILYIKRNSDYLNYLKDPTEMHLGLARRDIRVLNSTKNVRIALRCSVERYRLKQVSTHTVKRLKLVEIKTRTC